MNLCIDRGNTSTKIGIFNQEVPVLFSVFDALTVAELGTLLATYPIDNCIFSSVRNDDELLLKEIAARFPDFVFLTHETAVPVVNHYTTPETLGRDRLAAVVGASCLYPDKTILVIDAGTAITYDLLVGGCDYLGGNIAPGLEMRLKALHHFTQKLPLVVVDEHVDVIGTNTETAIGAGCFHGLIFEIEGYIACIKFKYPELLVLLTGGNNFFLAEKLKNAIFVEPNLVLIGLNRILQYNVQK